MSETIANIPVNPDQLLTWGVPGLLFVAALVLLRPWFRRFRERRALCRLVRGVGQRSMQNVILDDGMDGLVFIDHLVLTADAIVVLSVMRMRGAIFGGEGIHQWAQVVGTRTLRFANPVDANIDRIAAVRLRVPDAPVVGRVLFIGGCTFPKGRPEAVLLPEDIAQPTKEPEAVSEQLEAAWQTLTEEARNGSSADAPEAALLHSERLLGRGLLALTATGAAVAWLAWRFGVA